MGQGLHTKMLQVAATTLGIPLAKVRLAPTRTDKVPNTSATAASSGADLNGGAVKNACEQIKERLLQVAATSLGISPADVRIEDGEAHGVAYTSERIPWDELVKTAYFRRVQLFAAGYYRTEGLHWDSQRFEGVPFKYFAYGVAATEVEVDGFTGAYRTRRVDIVHDVGDSLSPLVDIGQIEGGFVQGAGWLTLEDLRWDESDRPTPRAAQHPGGQHLQAAELLRDARGVQRRPPPAGPRGRRGLRLQGRRRAAAHARVLGPGGAPPGGGRVRAVRHQRRPRRRRPPRRPSTGRSSRRAGPRSTGTSRRASRASFPSSPARTPTRHTPRPSTTRSPSRRGPERDAT